MSKTKAAATTAKTKAAGQAANSPAKTEVDYKCVVLAQKDGSLVNLGSMQCGAGARATLPESKAKAAEKAGFVKIVGLA